MDADDDSLEGVHHAIQPEVIHVLSRNKLDILLHGTVAVRSYQWEA